jgi:hypothetical protein
MKFEEKAKELVDSFLGIQRGFIIPIIIAKQCAKLVIDEQIKLLEEEMIMVDYNCRKIFIDELFEVKNEIEKL